MFTDYVQVAVAEDHAVVTDGGIPTGLSIADLASDDPTRLTPLEPPIAVMNQFLATVGDTIVLVGNRCDQGVKDLGIDYVCEPGTPFVYLFDPASAKWTSLSVPTTDGTFAGVTVAPSSDSATTLNALVRTPAAPGGQRLLFTLDVDRATVTAQSMPTGYESTSQGGHYECFGADGAETLMLTASMEDVAGSGPSRVWWRGEPSADWSAVALPGSGDIPWMPEECVAGDLMISHRSGAGRRVAILDGPTKTWRVLDGQALALPSGAELTGLVHEPNRSRSWINGQLWKTDPATGQIENTGVPGEPVANVRWSVPWGAGKVVALVGERADPSAADRRMDLHLVVVDTANDAH